MVNPAVTAALVAASRQEEVEAKVEGRLKKARAFSPASAIALELKEKEQQLLDQALASGTVKRTDDGRLYLNERVIADRKEGQGFMALLILLAIASVVASLAVLADSAGS
ncbi:MAG: hypothetical protein M3Q19_07175 [Pseudomonadota bacterium]|nr:hypothetical protein [Pseudomonadota bacterium]